MWKNRRNEIELSEMPKVWIKGIQGRGTIHVRTDEISGGVIYLIDLFCCTNTEHNMKAITHGDVVASEIHIWKQ